MAETGNTTRTQLINLEGLSAFLDESKKIFEPTLPTGTNGQVLKLSGDKPTWGTDNTPTAFKWTNGTTAGPTGSLTGNGMSAVGFGAIPSAGASASGVVTTGAQTFAGTKTFSSPITGSLNGNASTATAADKTAHSLSVKDGAATPVAAINSWNGSADKTLTIKGESPVTTTATDGTITITHATSGVTAGTYKSVTVDAKGHVTGGTNPSTLSGYGITDAKIASGVITLGSNTITPLTSASTLSASKVNGTLATNNIPNLDASKITTGTISVDRLPATALERCVVVADDTARFKLTTSSVQVGDTVKVTATKKMYMVIDSSKLSSEAGYEEYFTSTDWSTITGKPSSYTPSSHTHTKSQITDFPSSMPASDVYAWAKAKTKPSYAWSEITSKPSTFTPASHSHDAATQSANGFMSAADKTKLDGITESADSVSFTRSLTSGTKVGTITINGTGTDLYAPTNTDTHYTAKNVVASSSTGTANVTAETNNPYLNLIENGAVRSTHRISGSGATSVKTDTSGNITISSTNTTYPPATQSANGLMSSTDKTKLDGIATGAEVNQNAFSNVKVGDVTVAADSKTDTLTLVAGSNVTITPDATNDKITIASSYVNTTYSAGTDLSLSGTTFNHANSGATAGTYRSVTVNARGHVTAGTNPTTLSGYGITDAKIASGVITLGSNTITPLTSSSTLAASKVSGTLATSNIPNLDASKITTGTISVDRLPATALERCVVVANDTARFALTTASVQVGDTVKVTGTKKMYMVVDSSKLSSEAGYEEYFTSTDWSTITNKPSSYTPSSHTHTKSQITDFPTKMPASDVHDWAKAENKPSYAWSEITSKPSTFTPSTHTHSDATTSASGFMSSTDKAKLDGIAPGAEVNQNAFSNVTVGSTTISADSKTDTLTLTAGNNITLTPDAANDKITISSSYVAASASTSGIVTTETQTFAGAKTFSNTTDSTNNTSGAVIVSGGLGVAKNIYAAAVHNAVWNDLADCIPVDDECEVEPGYCYCFDGERYYKSTKYLDEGIVGIDSDTYGMNMGHKPGLNQMDVAVAGFVLAYVDREYKPGTPLTCTENGYLTEIKRKDKIEYPERIVATYWKSESADEWGSDSRKVKVNGRKWVKVV